MQYPQVYLDVCKRLNIDPEKYASFAEDFNVDFEWLARSLEEGEEFLNERSGSPSNSLEAIPTVSYYAYAKIPLRWKNPEGEYVVICQTKAPVVSIKASCGEVEVTLSQRECLWYAAVETKFVVCEVGVKPEGEMVNIGDFTFRRVRYSLFIEERCLMGVLDPGTFDDVGEIPLAWRV